MVYHILNDYYWYFTTAFLHIQYAGVAYLIHKYKTSFWIYHTVYPPKPGQIGVQGYCNWDVFLVLGEIIYPPKPGLFGVQGCWVWDKYQVLGEKSCTSNHNSHKMSTIRFRVILFTCNPNKIRIASFQNIWGLKDPAFRVPGFVRMHYIKNHTEPT